MSAQLRRLLLDLGPLVVFFIVLTVLHNVFIATGVFMVLAVVSLIIGYVLEKRVSPMALFSVAIVLVMGGLTIYLKNDLFVKIKPTITYATFCIVLLGGLAFNRLFIKYALSFEFEMPDAIWRTLTWRWGLFFAVQAILNEIAWRNLTLEHWAAYKLFIALPLTFVFGALQAPILLKHMPADKPAA